LSHPPPTGDGITRAGGSRATGAPCGTHPCGHEPWSNLPPDPEERLLELRRTFKEWRKILPHDYVTATLHDTIRDLLKEHPPFVNPELRGAL
jgi:hypothetical protein